jgi:hypothetical protein
MLGEILRSLRSLRMTGHEGLGTLGMTGSEGLRMREREGLGMTLSVVAKRLLDPPSSPHSGSE